MLVDQLGVDSEEVTESSTFIEDLGCDSLDTVEILFALEEEFGIEMDEEEMEKIKTVGEARSLIDDLTKQEV